VEPVSEVLSRFAPGGVVVESTAVTANPDDSEGHAVGPLRVAAYFVVDDRLESTRNRLDEALWYLGRIRPLPEAAYRLVQEADWAEAWKQHYQPIEIGKRLVIVPAWLENPQPQRIPIRIDPGMAFGTGTHPSTQLCLELLETLVEVAQVARAGDYLRLIDLGCGTAILAVAGILLGVSAALGVDIDPLAVRVARENAAVNDVASSLELGEGSLNEILAGHYSISQAQIVLANILAPVLKTLLDEGLERLVTPGGWLVLSGILAEQADALAAEFPAHSLELVYRKQIGDWVALAAQRR
jgi:ribosomal protein L11 methyltransferase